MKNLLTTFLFVVLSTMAFSQSVDDKLRTVVAAGTDTYTISEPIPVALDSKERFLVRFTNGNSTSVTLNRFGLGAKAVKKAGGVDLVAGDIAAGGTYLLSYNGTYYQVVGDGGSGGGGGGSGTVTSVSVTTVNGVSGTVANPTSTPAISLTLGAITPTSVAASSTVTGSNLSGTNTGDQDLSGLLVKSSNLSDLTNTTTARTNLGLGTLATQSGTFSGTSSGTNTGDQTISDATITTSNITTNNVSITKHGFAPILPNDATKYLDGTGAYSIPAGGGGGVTSVSGTTNRITSTGGTTPVIDISASYVGQSSITTLGTIGAGVWNGTKVAEGFGGTNQSTYTLGDILYSSAGNTLSKLAGTISTTRQFLSQTGNGSVSAAPAWGTILAGDVPTLNQNTSGSAATLTTSRSIYGGSFNGSADVTGIIASTFGGTGNGFTKFTGPLTTEKVFTLPDATTTIVTTNMTGALATGILKSTTTTGALTIAVAGDFPTLNQTTTGSAATLTTGRTISTTGDVSYTSGSFNGSANVTGTATVTAINGTTLSGLTTGILKNTTTTGVPSIAVAGDFPTLNQSTTGSAATLTTPRTINGTSFNGSANITVTADASTLTGTSLNATVVGSSLTSVGTIATGTWNATTIGIGKGGTGQTSASAGFLALAPSITSNALKFLRVNAGATDYELVSLAGGGDALTSAPLSQFASTTSSQFFGVISDETGGSGSVVGSASPTLTGITTVNSINLGTQSIATATGTTTLTSASPNYTVFTGSAIQTVVLPNATTLSVGQRYEIDNISTGLVTVQTNGGATLWTQAGGTDLVLILTDNSTSAGVWQTEYEASSVSTGKVLAATNSLTLSGTDATTMTFPSTSATIARTDAANTFTGTQTFNGAIVTAAGTTSLVPINIPTSAQQTTPAGGDVTRNASGIFTAAVAAAENGVVPSTQYSVVGSDFTLSAALGVQSCFPTTGDVWTLAASTLYEVEGSYTLTTGTTTTKTTALAFALGGGASVNFVNINVMGWNGVPGTTATAQGTVNMNGVASTVVTATATTAGAQFFFKGLISMNAAGTVTPQINFSANPGGTNLMKAGSYIRFTKLGANTFTVIGSVN